MHVAYLVNQYPKVSHSFVRREIQALEQEGLRVSRFSVRKVNEPLLDAQDIREAERTHVLLDGGKRALVTSLATTAARFPMRFAQASELAARCGFGSDRGVALHGAYLAEACLLREACAAERVDHVHAHFGTNSATVAMLTHALGGPTFSFTVHGPEEFDKPEGIALREKIARCTYVFGVSHFGRSQLYRWADFGDWPKVKVVRCGIPDAWFEGAPSPVPDLPHLVSVGRLAPQKGQMILVQAVARIIQSGLPLSLVLVGDGELRAEIEKTIAEKGIQDFVRITGWADEAKVRKEVLAARAFVLPSFAEGLPVAIMEAFALGRPVVSTYVAGIPELVEPGKNGWLVPAGSVDALEVALRDVLSKSAKRLGEMAAAGRTRTQEMHAIGISVRKLKQLFLEARR